MSHHAPGLKPATDRPEEKPVSNAWEELLPLLDSTIITALPDKRIWQQLDPEMVRWLVNTVSKTPWLNHLALAGAIYSLSGAAHPLNPIRVLHYFLRDVIPSRFADLAALNPHDALIAYYGQPPSSRGTVAYKAYSAIQLHIRRYLEAWPLDKRDALTPFGTVHW